MPPQASVGVGEAVGQPPRAIEQDSRGDGRATRPIDAYALWTKGHHRELLAAPKPSFLAWAANHRLFPAEQWTAKFLAIGELKRQMWRAVGRQPFPWAPLVELRMPLGCTAACTYCEKAIPRYAPHTNSKASLLRSIAAIKFPETIGLCGEWGDPCLHPEVIEAVNERIERDWLVTRYTFLTNLSAKPAVLKALPYIRNLLVHFTMSEPAHALTIMGYKNAEMFEQVIDNLHSVLAVSKGSPATKVILQFVVDPTTLPFVAAHYARFKDMVGLHSIRYKPAWKFARTQSDMIAAAHQKAAIDEMKGAVPHDWRV